MSTVRRVAAVDLGATSGRVMVGTVGPDRLDLTEAHRFDTAPVQTDGALRWDVRRLYDDVLAGLRIALEGGPLHGIGIDSWAIDHGLLDNEGELLADPYCYRDPRTDGIAQRVADEIGAAELYRRNGLQRLPFNTVYQLLASAGAGELEAAGSMLLLPDLLGYWLTGVAGAERTNASTTGLHDVRRRSWDLDLVERLGLPTGLLPPLRTPGTVLGDLRPEVAERIGAADPIPVVTVTSHDTAAAVVATPLDGRPAAYLSSGTWSLVGVELAEPVLSDAARQADFTNEAGLDDTVRFLTNVMGLWVLSQSLETWGRPGLAPLLQDTAAATALRTVVNIDHPSLLPPGDMPSRLAAVAEAAGEPVPTTRPEVVRTILDSLALAYRRQVSTVGRLAGFTPEVVHVVGGGSRNELLCQLTADACGVPVLAGPAEASALGNVLVQARALGLGPADLDGMRDLVRRSHPQRRFDPTPDLDWAAAETRLPNRDGVFT